MWMPTSNRPAPYGVRPTARRRGRCASSGSIVNASCSRRSRRPRRSPRRSARGGGLGVRTAARERACAAGTATRSRARPIPGRSSAPSTSTSTRRALVGNLGDAEVAVLGLVAAAPGEIAAAAAPAPGGIEHPSAALSYRAADEARRRPGSRGFTMGRAGARDACGRRRDVTKRRVRGAMPNEARDSAD